MPVVNVTNAALDMILNPVHGIAAEAERRDGRPMGAAQIVRRGTLDLELGADLAHGGTKPLGIARAKHESGRTVADNLAHWCGQPYAMILRIFCTRPLQLGHPLT